MSAQDTKADPSLLSERDSPCSIRPLVVCAILLGIAMASFMGLYAVATRAPPSGCAVGSFRHIKVPALFFLTLVVTFPSLYVLSALFGVRLGPADTFRLILVPITVNLAVLASLGTITTGFFTLSTTSYEFMKLLNVFFFGVSGLIGPQSPAHDAVPARREPKPRAAQYHRLRPAMFSCPQCNVPLTRQKSPSLGCTWVCPSCRGRALTLELLRHVVPQPIVNRLWQRARSGQYAATRRCPACNRSDDRSADYRSRRQDSIP